MATHKRRANIYKTNKDSLLMSVRFTTVSLTLPLLPTSSHLKACLPDRLAFHTGETTVEWYRKHAHTDRYTDSQIHTQTDWHTYEYSHSHSFTHIVCISVDFGAMTRISLQLPASLVVCPLSPIPASVRCPCTCPLPPALNHCCHCPFAQQLLRDNLCPHSPQTFPFVVCANPCADKSA